MTSYRKEVAVLLEASPSHAEATLKLLQIGVELGYQQAAQYLENQDMERYAGNVRSLPTHWALEAEE